MTKPEAATGEDAMSQETFVLLHGAFHGAWCWSLVASRLQEQGFMTITPRLASDNPAKNMHDHANQVAARIGRRRKVHLVAHSRFAGIGLELAAQGLLQQLTIVAGGVHEATDQPGQEIKDPVRKYAPGYLEAIHPIGNLSYIDKFYARDIFYHDCPPALASQAVSRLRLQNRQDEGQPLPSQPDLPITYIVCERDRVLNPEWQVDNTTNLLPTAELQYIDSGHSPFLSRPAVLTSLITAAAKIV